MQEESIDVCKKMLSELLEWFMKGEEAPVIPEKEEMPGRVCRPTSYFANTGKILIYICHFIHPNVGLKQKNEEEKIPS